MLAFGLCGKGEESKAEGFEDDFLQFNNPDGAVAFRSEGGEVYSGVAAAGAIAFCRGGVLSEAVGAVFFQDRSEGAFAGGEGGAFGEGTSCVSGDDSGFGCGSAAGEIDSLCWGQVDFNRQLIRLEETERGGLKSRDSRAEVPIDENVVAILRGFHAKLKSRDTAGVFVVPGAGEQGGHKKWGRHYRADAVFTRLTDWLRAKGVDARKPLHELRKELGALVTAEHGIYAASRVLRHADVSTTARHYSDLKTRPLVNVGAWLLPENVAGMETTSKCSPPKVSKQL